ncbi:MAG TPA: V-type ATP synthase subunit D [Gaiellaceae bacterium]|nr:V-type ATP synthase subunit D [Gaiellaceae bacterium]
MPLRLPTGRAGRPWLVRRLATARRGAEVLDQKRQALLRLERRLAELLSEAEADWLEAAREAETWLARAAVIGGERALELAAFYSREPARIEIAWRRTLGLAYPAEAAVTHAPAPDLSALGGSSALVYAGAAHRSALAAAAAFATTRLAHERAAAELKATTRRLRAVERRWIPRHEEALAALELALDEGEREEAARIRWIARRQPAKRREHRVHAGTE